VPRRFDLRPQNDVRATAVSPDKRWVATCSWNPDPVSSVQLWEAQTGVHAHNLPLKTLGNCAWFSPDSRWLITTVFGVDTHLWEVGTWREVRTYAEAYVAFSPKGEVMALGDEAGIVRLVAPENNREIARLTGPEPIGYDPACFTADGTHLIAEARDRHAVYVWDLQDIRRQLQNLGLDWDLPPFPPQPPPGAALKVEVDRGYLSSEAEFLDAGAAVAFLSFALLAQPVSPEAYYHRGIALDRLRMREQAVADHSKFLALTPPGDRRRAEVLYRRAEDFAALKDDQRAIRDLLEMASLNLDAFPWPEIAARFSNNLAWNRVVKPAELVSLDDALRLAQLAIRLDSSLFTRNTLGVLYYRLGRWREAVNYLEANVELNPLAAWDLYFLAMCYQRLGDATQAKDRFDRALRLHAEKLPPSLTDGERAELKAIRAEAEAVLRGK
jgi:tetratricopeptide (TPR) repeat protein